MLEPSTPNEPLVPGGSAELPERRLSGNSVAAADGEAPFNASLCGRLNFTWVGSGVVRRIDRAARQGRDGTINDVYALPDSAEPDRLGQELGDAWRAQVALRGEKATITRALWACHWRVLVVSWLGFVLLVFVNYADPFFLNRFIVFAGDETATTLHGVFLAFCFLGTRLAYCTIENNSWMHRIIIGQTMKSGLVTVIFRKMLLLRQDTFAEFSGGAMNNMITTDVDNARKFISDSASLVTCPLKISISMIALHHFFGLATYVALIFLIMTVFINRPVMSFNARQNKHAQKKTDERVEVVGEILKSMHIVKCYAWEEAAAEKVGKARNEEISAIWWTCVGRTLIQTIWSSMVPITTLVLFTAHSLIYPDRPFSAAATFTSVGLLEVMQGALYMMPMLITNLIEGRVSARRIERLLLFPEIEVPGTAGVSGFIAASSQVGDARRHCVDVSDFEVESGDDALQRSSDDQQEIEPDVSEAPPAAVNFRGASFAWPAPPTPEAEEDASSGRRCTFPLSLRRRRGPTELEIELREPEAGPADAPVAPEFLLRSVGLKVPRGALVFVVGATASGKTSLLQAALGEMPQLPQEAHLGGRPATGGAVAFAPQVPWVFNGTARQNILFGASFNRKLYEETVEACDLERDFGLLGSGDLTLVGEKGIALSGGQKARLCLARAVYRRKTCDIILLDDPYSALDAHVARKVHDRVVQGLLHRCTRLVVTNRLEFVSTCNFIVVLERGHIKQVGSYEELSRSCEAFRSLLSAQETADSSAEKSEMAPSEPLSLERQISCGSAEDEGSPTGADNAAHAEEEPAAEEHASGNVSKEIVMHYLRKLGGPCVLSLLLLAYVACEVLRNMCLWWLAKWTSEERVGDEQMFYLLVYVAIQSSNVLGQILTRFSINILGFRASTQLHGAMFESLLRAPMQFYQDTPHGRIINRFSSDTSEVDRNVAQSIDMTARAVCSTTGCFIMVGITASISLVPFAPLAGVYWHLQKMFNRANTILKRLSKTTASPMYDHFNTLCRENGLSTVRSFHEVETQIQRSDRLIGRQMRCPLAQLYVDMWYYQRVEPLGAVLVFFVSLYVAFGHNRFVSAGSAALAIQSSLTLIGRLPILLRMLTDITIAFNCVERMVDYTTNLPIEAPAVVPERRPPAAWPSAGVLQVRDLRFRYRPALPLVLKGISFALTAGERLGIVGRTGAGKSSLLVALFRIVEPEAGSVVLLDGEDLLTMGLKDLRSRLAMIPQDPVLFQATLRYNCDPFGRHSDEAVWAALEEAQLAPWVREQGEGAAGLDLQVQEGGQNLSAGQRQLVAIARAVLRSSKLVVLDEATAALDAATDQEIQKAVRRCFAGASTLTIAHRLQTILDCDRVMVLADGEIAELGSPATLCQKEDGVFRSMVAQHEKR